MGRPEDEVARRLLDFEGQEYHLDSASESYEANEKSRFDNLEIVVVLGYWVRRLALLKGIKAGVGRKGFDGDLKDSVEASLEDYMLALYIAGRVIWT